MRLAEYVKKASKDAVVDGVKLLLRYNIHSNRLISKSNPLVKNGLKAIDSHGDLRIPYAIPQAKINQFLAASSLSHMLDGWMYLSNAFSALLNGDEGTAIHLGYYAELRSAMSILSTEGIAAFSDKHIGAFSPTTNSVYPLNYFKTGTGGYVRTKSPTHIFVWDAMEKWSKSSTKPSDDILKIFKVQGLNFYDITEYFHPATVGSTLMTVVTIKEWLKEWCFDIKHYKTDRQNRNDVSYRPQRILNFSENLNFQDIINDLSRFWNVISPTKTDQFDLLDKYLLRKLFEKLYSQINTVETIDDLITNAFGQHGIYDKTLFDFMTFKQPFADDHIIFTHANLRRTTALSIIARATLLLRISVGMVSQLYKAGGVKKSDLNFIWNNYSVDNGFWTPATPLADFDILWSNVEPMLEELKIDLNTQGSDNSIYSIRERKPVEIIHLTQINRACLWGLDF